MARRFSRPRCAAKLGTGKACRKFALEGSPACGVKAHQHQVANAMPAISRRAQRARVKALADQGKFVACYAEHGVLTRAAEEADIDPRRHYEWLERPDLYPDYKAEFDEAYERATDLLEVEAFRRGHDGYLEPKFGTGPGPFAGTIEVGTIRRFSDRMLELLLKARRPQEYRERSTVQVGVGVNASRVEIILPDNGLRRDSQVVLE